MIAIIDYEAGNIMSVKNALLKAGAECIVTSEPEIISHSGKVILPGVGEASVAMENLRKKGLDKIIPELTQPVLGICIGMQLMCISSEEGGASCLGIFDCKVRKFKAEDKEVKIPHMGWNRISTLSSPLFEGIKENEYMYYVHSYYPEICRHTIAETEYAGLQFSAALQKDNFFGTQFHPEKSGGAGARIIKNFIEL